MRTTLAALSLGFLVAAATLASPRTARAEQEFDVRVSGGKITVVTKGEWHINKDYPWKLVDKEKKPLADKTKFALEEKTATLSGAPKGHAKLKGALCSGDECKTFEKEIDVD